MPGTFNALEAALRTFKQHLQNAKGYTENFYAAKKLGETYIAILEKYLISKNKKKCGVDDCLVLTEEDVAELAKSLAGIDTSKLNFSTIAKCLFTRDSKAIKTAEKGLRDKLKEIIVTDQETFDLISAFKTFSKYHLPTITPSIWGRDLAAEINQSNIRLFQNYLDPKLKKFEATNTYLKLYYELLDTNTIIETLTSPSEYKLVTAEMETHVLRDGKGNKISITDKLTALKDKKDKLEKKLLALQKEVPELVNIFPSEKPNPMLKR